MNTAADIQMRPLVLEDLRALSFLNAASTSADGHYLAYVNSKVVWDDNEHKDYITLVHLTPCTEIKVWEGSAPLWSPVANEIAYLAGFQGETYIWIYSLAADSHRPVTPVYESHYFMGHLSVKNFAWSPDGLKIAYVSAQKTNAASTASPDVKVIDRLLYKSKGGRGRPVIADDMLSHVWVVPAAGGNAQLLTDGAYNEHSICWSPDSTKIAFVSNRSADPDNNQLHDLWSVDLMTKKTSRHTENLGTVNQPAWSPDGKHIAFLATLGKIATNDSPAEDTQVYIVATADNVVRCLTASFDRRVEQVNWHPKDNVVYFTAGDKGTIAIYRIAIGGEHVIHVTGEHCQITGYAMNNAGDEICYIKTDATHLTEIYLYNLKYLTTRKVTRNSDDLLQSCRLQEAETFWFRSFDKKDVQGWIMKPAAFNPNRKYPLVLVIHGGPHNMFGYAFEDRMQLLSAKGYGVLFINPRGSSGYGQAFSNGTLMNWGGGDFKDLMAGVEEAIENNSWIDSDRLGVTGQSYGGYMTNWIITQTNIFKAAVVDGGISNLVSFAGTSLYHSLIESEFNGSAYDNYALLWDCSPLKNVKQVTTPTLILHGEVDNEVPLSQAEEMYIALKKNGVETNFVQYLGEGHGWRPDLKPWNRHDLLQRMWGWFDKYLGG